MLIPTDLTTRLSVLQIFWIPFIIAHPMFAFTPVIAKCTGKLKLDTKMWGLYSSIVVNCTNRHSVLDTEVTSEIYKAGTT